MMKFLKFPKVLAMSAIVLALFAACSDDNDDTPPNPRVVDDFHIAFASGTESNSATLLQGVSDLTTGEISPRIGHQMESSRTARVFVSADGATIWSLNYTVGTIEKLTYQGVDKYTRVARIDASVPLGAATVRFTKINEEIGSVHYIAAKAQYEVDSDPTTYLGHKMTASVGMLNLETMTMVEGYKNAIDVEMDEELAKEGYYVSRIDCPVISGGKLYYGAALQKFNPLTNKGVAATDKACTLVMDYPALTNATVVMTSHVAGATNGYRTPTQHINEAGEILQLVSGNDEVHIVKLVNGKYTSFDFNLSEKLGKGAASNGFFYAGNGIAYIPYEDLSKDKIQIGVNPSGEPSYSAMWKLARMDFNKGTVIDLNVPDDLWLTQYQNGVIHNGTFYIALSPVGVNGNIYMFDISSESPNGKLGASITGTGADQYYIGIF